MIKELIIECEEITRVETNQGLGNNIKVTLSCPLLSFIEDMNVSEVIWNIPVDEALEAIVKMQGMEYIKNWYEGINK